MKPLEMSDTPGPAGAGPAASTSTDLARLSVDPGALRVLVVVQSLDASQSGTSAFNMASHLVASGIAVTVMSEGGRNLQTLLRRKATHIAWKAPGDGPLGQLRAVRRLSRVIDDNDITHVHVFGRVATTAVRAAADKKGIHMIASVPGSYNLEGWGVWKKTKAMCKADRLIVPSGFVRLWLKDQMEVREETISVIAPGIDLGHFNPAAVKAQRMIELARHHGIPEEDQIILMPARLIGWKGHKSVIEAFESLKRENTTLVIAGDSSLDRSYADGLQTMVEDLRLAAKVRFLDFVDDMPALYMLSDVVIEAPDEPVAFARASVEAQAMGRPVVTSSVGGGPDAVRENKTGWLAAPKDSEAIADALSKALDLDADGRKSLALAARAHARDHFDLSKCTAKVQALYEAIART